MALRSGYYGLKNSVKRTLEKLASDMSGAKIIKTIGDGLSLSEQGALAANIDSDTMEFKDHKLAAKITSGFTRTVLWGNDTITYPPTKPATVDLTDSYLNYDALIIITGFTSTNVYAFQPWLISVPELEQCDVDPSSDTAKLIALPCNTGSGSGGQWARVANHGSEFDSLSFRYNGDIGIYKIIGLKF